MIKASSCRSKRSAAKQVKCHDQDSADQYFIPYPMQRRSLLSSSSLALAVSPLLSFGTTLPTSASEEPSNSRVLIVDNNRRSEDQSKNATLSYTTISDALQDARAGDTVLITTPGIYRERLLISTSVCIEAATDIVDDGKIVEIAWETDNPYESTVTCHANGSETTSIYLKNLVLSHKSPSIANNYAVYVYETSNATGKLCIGIENCDITSSTGSGIGIEGVDVEVSVSNCMIHRCARNGLMIFGSSSDVSLDNDVQQGTGSVGIRGCIIEGNALHGMLVRDDARPVVIENSIQNNKGYGLVLQGCSGEYRYNTLQRNGLGGVAFHGVDSLNGKNEEIPAVLLGSNTILDRKKVEERKV